jgi:hypothetical protein
MPESAEDLPFVLPERVMAGLVPAIHAAPLQGTFEVGVGGSAWMPGTRPGMTRGGCKELSNYNQFRFPGQPCASREKGGFA